MGTHGGCLKFERPDKQAVCLHGLSRNADGSGMLHTAGPKGEDLDEPMTGEEMDAVSKATDSNDIASEGRMKMRIMADPQKNIVLLNTDGNPKSTFTTQEFIKALVSKGVRQAVADRLVEFALKSVGRFVEFVPSEEKARTGSLDKAAFSIYAVAPEGWEDVVKAIKSDQSANPSNYKGEGSPWAIAWAAKNKGYKRNGGKVESEIITKKYLEENFGDEGYIPDAEEGHDEQGQDKDSGRSGPSKEASGQTKIAGIPENGDTVNTPVGDGVVVDTFEDDGLVFFTVEYDGMGIKSWGPDDITILKAGNPY